MGDIEAEPDRVRPDTGPDIGSAEREAQADEYIRLAVSLQDRTPQLPIRPASFAPEMGYVQTLAGHLPLDPADTARRGLVQAKGSHDLTPVRGRRDRVL